MAKESEEPEGSSGDAAQSSQGKQPRLSTVPSQWGKKPPQKCNRQSGVFLPFDMVAMGEEAAAKVQGGMAMV